jgi:hypothetical protein
MAGHMGHRDLNGLDRSIDQDAGQMAVWIDHRLQHRVVTDVAQLVHRRQGVGTARCHSRVGSTIAAVHQGLPYVVERDAADQALVVLDDQAAACGPLSRHFDDRKQLSDLLQMNAVVNDFLRPARAI